MDKQIDAFYFGVWPGTDHGHFLYAEGSNGLYFKPYLEVLPFKLHELDSTFCPKTTRQQGAAKLRWPHKEWTTLAFWDQTGDSRPGSHSTFVLRGQLKFEEALERAKSAFPQVMTRAMAEFDIEPMCCSICREPSGYEIDDIYEFVCDGCAQ